MKKKACQSHACKEPYTTHFTNTENKRQRKRNKRNEKKRKEKKEKAEAKRVSVKLLASFGSVNTCGLKSIIATLLPVRNMERLERMQ